MYGEKVNISKFQGLMTMNNVNWDGRVIGGHIGFDTKLSANVQLVVC